MKVYVTRKLAGGLTELSKRYQVDVNPHDRPCTRDELLAVVKEYDAVICLLNDRIDRELLEVARGVKIFANYAVGYDNIDVQAAREFGIAVSNTPGVLTEATADLAWALLLAAARHVVPAHSFTSKGKFTGWHPTMYMGRDFSGATLGIVGAGRIGQATARRGVGFGMNVVYYNRSPKPDFEKQTSARRLDLEQLLKESDFVSLHLPLTSDTRHLLDERRLGLLKPTAILVNTARGPVVDEAALAKILKNKEIFAAGLDVFEREPEIHPDLIGLENVVMLPHLGSASWNTRIKMAEMAAANVQSVLSGKPPVNPVE